MTMADPPASLVTRLRFRHLRMLVELERCGSIGKAAAALHLTQPALSKMLQEVEQAFGFALYHRDARGLRPTAQGEAALLGARVLLQELGHVHESVVASGQQPAAVLHLGVPSAVAAGALPDVLRRLHEDGPPVLVKLREEPVPALFDALVAGELDALLTSFTAAALADDRPVRLVYELCVDHAYAVIAPSAHPLAGRRRVGWQDLLEERWILPERNLLSRQGLDAYFVQAGIALPQPAITSNHPATNVQLVAAGLGISSVPESVIGAEERTGRIVRLPVPMHARRVPTALIYRAGTARHPVLQRLRQAVQACRKEGPGAAA